MNNIDTKAKPANWRSPESHRRYMEYIEAGGLENGCRLCEAEALYETTHWRIIPNKYPYDRVALTHHMAIPKRHTKGDDLTHAELKELDMLKQTYLNDHYHFIVEALPRTKSIPAHLHFHLLTPNQG